MEYQQTTTILRTPIEVSEWTRTHIPLSSLGCRDTTLTLTLPVSLSSLTIRTAVAAEKLLETIRTIETNSLLGKNIEVDPGSFSFSLPLYGWADYHRIILVASGGSCKEKILNFLLEEKEIDTLTNLGLSPSQLKESCSEEELRFFYQAYTQCSSDQQQKRFGEQFRIHYPQLTEQFIRMISETERQFHRQTRENAFENILKILEKSVLGQEYAKSLLTKTIIEQTITTKCEKFLFVGPTGVGKTELAKAVAAFKGVPLITLPMNQYQSRDDYVKIFGVAAKFVGSGNRSHFANEIYTLLSPHVTSKQGSITRFKVSNAVILFDEMEKAHYCVKQSLLTLFDEQHLKIEYTQNVSNIVEHYDFEKSIFICTSNLFQEIVLEHKDSKSTTIADKFKNACTKTGLLNSNNFSPEFLGRITVVPFTPIPKGGCFQKLLKVKLDSFFVITKRDLNLFGICYNDQKPFFEELEKRLYGNGTDIRKIDRWWNNHVLPIFYQNMANWGDPKKTKIVFSFDKTALFVEIFMHIKGFDRFHPIATLPL